MSGATEHPDRLVVVGAGTMGTQIALQAALRGIDVTVVDTDRHAVARSIAETDRLIDSQLQRGAIGPAEAEEVRARLVRSDDLGDAEQCTWAIEAVLERLDVKRAVFRDLDRVLPPSAAIASNSSSVVASRLADATARPDRCLNMHFFHPVLVMDLCEISGGPLTALSTIDAAVRWCERLGRRPIVLAKEVDGFVVNRILGAASREAFNLVAAGVVQPAEVDVAVRHALRWPLGPFQLADLSGLDVVLDVRRERNAREPDDANQPTIDILAALVDQGRLGRKSGVGFYDYSTDPPNFTPLPA